MRLPHHCTSTQLLIAALPLLNTAPAFYLPGVAPTSYKDGDLVPLLVNHLTPAPTNDGSIRAAESWDYYSKEFHFCAPKGGPRSVSESLGSILFGDRIQTSPIQLRMLKNEQCRPIPGCGPAHFSPGDAEKVNNLITEAYNINWLIDGLPASQKAYAEDENGDVIGEVGATPGFQLGYVDEEKPVLNNHFEITVEYHKAGNDAFRVVGVEVEPYSQRGNKYEEGGETATCQAEEDIIVLTTEDHTTFVYWTYSIEWKESSTPFATRWDKYLHVYDPKIHWLILINSAVIVVFLSGMVFAILVRTLRKDITRYNRLDTFVLEDMDPASNGHANGDNILEDGVAEDSGWKLIHGDVFRPPKYPLLLSILVGNGMQLFLMTGFTIAFALFGFLSPSNRGSLGSVAVLLFTCFSIVGGFSSSYTFKCLGGEDKWKQNIILTPTALPAVVFSTFFLLNLFLWAQGSSGAVPLTTMLVIILIWFIISMPLSLAGSWLAFKRQPIKPPVKTNQIPRQIPEQSYSGINGLLNRPVPSMLMTGILPFGAIFVEVYFIMTSLWSNKFYYMFGFLFVAFGLMIVTCATVTVLSVYFLLCSENYRWQWRSFMTSGACAVWIFVNSCIFWVTRLKFQSWTSSVLFFGYSALISVLVFVMTGMIGFACAWLFVARIYRSIKVD